LFSSSAATPEKVFKLEMEYRRWPPGVRESGLSFKDLTHRLKVQLDTPK